MRQHAACRGSCRVFRVEKFKLEEPSGARVFPHPPGNSPHSPPAHNAAAAAIASGTSGNPACLPVARQLPLTIGIITKDRVESVLARVRPFMQADGGDIELLNVEGNSADVRLTGMCAGCPSAHMTLYLGVETALREEMPEFETLRLR